MKESYDLLIVGGGINGTAIARDAAGRGLSVLLCEQDDLGHHTSSASTKLIHGGLRYLEHYEFRLVRESLKEREVLLQAAPHIIWPLRFVLPYDVGLRPAWFLRLGLFIYDYIGGRKILPPTRTLNLRRAPHAGVLQSRLKKGFEYSDCWVEDSRLVVLNARDAASKGADILTRTKVESLRPDAEGYAADIIQNGSKRTVKAKGIVNAAGPWVSEVAKNIPTPRHNQSVRLIKGSHIITRKLYKGDHAYIFQNADERIIFAIPYEHNYTLIGTTDVPYKAGLEEVKISDSEISYLCKAASEYFIKPIGPNDVVWTYSGIRPLYDDKSEDASDVTRDYVLDLKEFSSGAPFLSVYGGKITTSRKLAEHALEKLEPFYDTLGPEWTRRALFPGGDIPGADFKTYLDVLRVRYPKVDADVLWHLARSYGTCVPVIIPQTAGLGKMFGSFLSEAEVVYLVEHEFVTRAEDVLWRRTKAGLHMTEEERRDFETWFEDRF